MRMIRNRVIVAAALTVLAAAVAHGAMGPAGQPSSSTRWATDMYPGFDREDDLRPYLEYLEGME